MPLESTFRKKGKDRLAWKDAERRVAKRIGGRRHAMSGAHYSQKGDLSNELMLVESKSTEKASLTLKLEWVEKINREAMAQGKTPAVSFTFINMDKRVERDWIMVPLRFMEDLLKDIGGSVGEQPKR